MAQIYLMYTREDKAQVDGVYRRLQASGLYPWIDDDMLPGQHSQQEIARAIRTSDLILVFLSPNSVGRRGPIQQQFKMALAALEEIPENTIHTIPVRLDDVEIPEQFRFLHPCNLFEENGLERLLEAIRVGISQHSPSPTLAMPEMVLNQTIDSQLNDSSPLEIVSPATARESSQTTSHTKKAGECYTSANAAAQQEKQIATNVLSKQSLWRNPIIIAAVITAFATVIAPYLTSILNPPPQKHTLSLPNNLEMRFKLMPKGTFEKPFYMGIYEVTQAQWQAVMGDNPSHFKGDQHPVEFVSWDDAQKFCHELNAHDTSGTYRLPTATEWEYAARAGTSTAYSFGNDASMLHKYAWCNSSINQTYPVGSLEENPWKLYDMYGNVAEWVEERHTSVDRTIEAATDDLKSDSKHRIAHGGMFESLKTDCQSYSRRSYPHKYKYVGIGFRCAMEVK